MQVKGQRRGEEPTEDLTRAEKEAREKRISLSVKREKKPRRAQKRS